MKKAATNREWYPEINRVPVILLLCIAQFIFSKTVSSQEVATYETSRAKLVKDLKKRFIDQDYSQSIDQFYFAACDSLLKKNITVENRPIKIILIRLFDACEDKLNRKLITSLRIPSVNNYFLLTISAYKKQPIKNLYREIGIVQSSILESTFDGLALGDSITTFVGLREMVNTPYFISTRLYKPRYLPYGDTLLYYMANAAPDILAKKLSEKDSLFTSLVNRSRNMTVMAVASIRPEINYEKIIPFGLAIQERKITLDEIRKLMLTPEEYYRAFIDEVVRLNTNPQPEIRSFLVRPIIELNKKLANQYFISEINSLHESPDNIRFQILNSLTTRELYFLLIGGSGELYTSSFLYIYKKFITDIEATGLDKFLDDINYYQFPQFIANISGYGLADDLVSRLQEKKFATLAGKYFTILPDKQNNDYEIILDAMSMSEVLYEIRHHQVIREMLVKLLDDIPAPKVQNDIMMQRMYAGFKDILLDKSEYNRDNTYDVLSIERLKKQNTIVQACFFYDDEDAGSSFNNNIANYNTTAWEKTDRGNYIIIKSRVGNDMRVYMNKPKTIMGCDSAQNEMLRGIERDGYEVTSFIHRGHSYYLPQSLRKITPSGQFVFLGSCGGYNEVLKVFRLNPDVNIIATRNIGSKLINDPLLQRINTDIVNNKDINWDDVWQEFNSKFQSKHTKDLFSSYIPPNKYIGIKFIREVFNY